MKAVKRNLTVVLAILAVLMMVLGVVFMPKSNTTVSAAVKTESGFYIEDGASIRLVENETGIKWRAHLTKDKFDLIEAGDEEHPAGTIVEFGIRIKPRGTETWSNYPYFQATSVTSSFVWGTNQSEVLFNRAIYYDDLIKDINANLQAQGKPNLTPEQEIEYLRQAYTTNLVAEPYAIVDPTAEGENYTVAGESFDTDRSVQGVALYHLVNGTYNAVEGDTEEVLAEKASIRATLYTFLPVNEFNVNQTKFEAVDSFYSNYDAYGEIVIDAELQAILEAKKVVNPETQAVSYDGIKVYYGAKDVTDSYDATSGILALAKVDTLITEDGKPNDCLMIFDETSGEIYKQYFVGVTLAIDEAEDFKYFQLKGTLKISSSTNISYTSDVDDFVFDGYYVLLNNIDAGSYAHVTLLNLPVNANGQAYTEKTNASTGAVTRSYVDASSIAAAGVEKTNYGLSGTFDGRGYTVKNMFVGSHVSSTQNGLSLFGFVNGGTIKNVNFDHIYSANKENKPSGATAQNDCLVKTLIANHFVGNSVVEDVMITLGNMQSYAYASLFSTASADTRFTRVLVVSDNDRGINTQNYMFSQFYGTMEDVYFVDTIAPSVTTAVEYTINGSAVKVHKARYEAEYVDGVAINGVSTLFWKGTTKYDSTKDAIYNGETQITTYEPNVLTNAKRYTSISAMQNSTIANDFSSWNSDIWEIVNNVPYFANSLTGEYVAYVGDDALDIDFVRPMEVGDELAFTVKYAGSSILALPEVEILSGEEYVSLDENVITATTQSNQTSVVVKVTYRNNSWIQNLVVYNKVTPTEYAETLYFSAHDGKFYDANFNVVGLDTIFGENVTLVRALDAEGNYLTLGENGELLNVDLGANDDWKSTNYTLYTLDKGVIVNVLAADAIIDEVEDLSVLSIKEKAGYTGTVYQFGAGVYVNDGYYVLARDIDGANYNGTGKNYVHSVSNKMIQKADGSVITLNSRTIKEIEANKDRGFYNSTTKQYTHGFLGTFDGRGHTISNVNAGNEGIFGIVLDATIKDVALINCFERAGATTLAYAVGGGAKLENLYIETTNLRLSSSNYTYNSYAVANGFGDATLSKVVLNTYFGEETNYENIISQNNWSYTYYTASLGELSATSTSTGATTNASDVYVISLIPLFLSHSYNSGWRLVAEAEYVDDVKIETSARPGVKRYSSISAMQNTTLENDFTNWNSNLWEVVNGVPYFVNALSNADYKAYYTYNKEKVELNAEPIQMYKGETLTLSLEVKGNAPSGTISYEIVDGNQCATLNGAVLTAKEVTGTGIVTVKVTYRDKSFTQQIRIIPAIENHETSYIFDASTGKFYNNNFVVVGVNEIFGEEVNVLYAEDAEGNTLDVEDNVIQGLAIEGETFVILHTGYRSVKVTINALAQITVEGFYELDGEKVAVNQTALDIYKDQSVKFSLKVNGEDVVPTVTVIEGAELVNVNGLTVAPKASGLVTIKVGYGSFYVTQQINILNVEIIAEEYFFSAYDGKFFDYEYNTVALEDILGTATAVTDINGNELTIDAEDGYGAIITGLDLGKQDTWTNITLLISTDEATYKLNAKAAELILDQIEDLSYFQLKESATYISSIYKFAEGDFAWDGYYVLAKDIDGANYNGTTAKYAHDVEKGMLLDKDGKAAAISSRGISEVEGHKTRGYMSGGSYIHGFMGTFDGRGYTISNITTDIEGIFGMILGGTIKNVGFYNCTTHGKNLIAFGIGAGAVLENIAIETNDLAPSGKSGLSQSSIVIAKAIQTATLSKIVVNAYYGSDVLENILFEDGKGLTYYVWAGSLAYLTPDKTTTSDVYTISILPSYMTKNIKTHATAPNAWYVSQDAAVIDGVPNESSTAVAGVKRYSNVQAMENDKDSNNFSTWNSGVWEIVNGVPKFQSQLGVSVDATYTVDGQSYAMAQTSEYNLFIGKQVTYSVTIGGEKPSFNPNIEILSGNDLVELEGTTINAIANSGNVVVKISYLTEVWYQNITISNPQIDALAQEYHFSAYDGEFFDASLFGGAEKAAVVSYDAIFGEGAVITRAIGGNGQELTIVDNKITGLDLGEQTTWAETFLIVTYELDGEEFTVRVNITAADMVFDEATDFTYFTLDGNVGFSGGVLTYDGDDWLWDGYHVVVNNINAGTYTHRSNSTNGTLHVDARAASVSSIQPTPYGFSGVFDGQGYTIKNMYVDCVSNSIVTGTTSADAKAQQGLGLFTYVNNGVIKNVAFTNMYSGSTKPSGASQTYNLVVRSPFSTSIVNGSLIQDVYLSFYRLGATQRYFLCYNSDASSSINRVFIQDNDITRANANYQGFVGPASYATMTDVYVIESIAILDNSRAYYDVVGPDGSALLTKTYLHKALAEAEYVDSQLVTNPCKYLYDASANGKTYDVTSTEKIVYKNGTTTKIDPYTTRIISGVKRYTSAANMNTAEALALNDFTAWTATGFWTVTNGLPTMHPIVNA